MLLGRNSRSKSRLNDVKLLTYAVLKKACNIIKCALVLNKRLQGCWSQLFILNMSGSTMKPIAAWQLDQIQFNNSMWLTQLMHAYWINTKVGVTSLCDTIYSKMIVQNTEKWQLGDCGAKWIHWKKYKEKHIMFQYHMKTLPRTIN